MRDGCEICGVGRPLVETTLDLEVGRVHWTMWTCGHAARVVIDAQARELTSAPS